MRVMTYGHLFGATLNEWGLFESDDVWITIQCHAKWIGYV